MTRSADLGGRTWSEVPHGGGTMLVPLGSLEQHGPHLPLDTDTRIARAVSRQGSAALAADGQADVDVDGLTPVYVAPDIAYGASGEHEGFPGTVSLGREALELLLVEYGRSACRWVQRLVFVNGHGGNAQALRAATLLLRYEGRDVAWFGCSTPGADPHAGNTETSLLLHLSPEVVLREQVVVGNTQSIGSLMGALRAGGVAAVSDNGVLGDPTTATAAQGETLFDGLVTRLVSAVRGWTVDGDGQLR